jgi:Right handed beta helix region
LAYYSMCVGDLVALKEHRLQSTLWMPLVLRVFCVQGPDARVTLKQCTLANNEASGLWIVAGGTVKAELCDFQDNKCNGAAAWDLRSSIVARSCTFRRNIANGLRLLYGASGSLLTCTVAFNQDQGVEAGEAATRLRIDNSIITCMYPPLLPIQVVCVPSLYT